MNILITPTWLVHIILHGAYNTDVVYCVHEVKPHFRASKKLNYPIWQGTALGRLLSSTYRCWLSTVVSEYGVKLMHAQNMST